jgi:hypothetical protein
MSKPEIIRTSERLSEIEQQLRDSLGIDDGDAESLCATIRELWEQNSTALRLLLRFVSNEQSDELDGLSTEAHEFLVKAGVDQ